MPLLGLLNSLGGMSGIITTLIQPLGGWFADRLGRKPFVLIASIATIGAYALFALTGWLTVWPLLVVGVVFLGISAISRPAITSLTAESTRIDRQGSAFSLILAAQAVPGVLAPALGGWVADRLGYEILFVLILSFEAISLLWVMRSLRETRSSGSNGVDASHAWRAVARSFIPPEGLTGFYCACAADALTWGVGWSLIYGMATESLHFSSEQLGVLSSITSLSWVISQMPIGRYLDRHTTKAMLIASEAFGIPLFLFWLTQSQFEILAASQVFYGLTASSWVPTVNTFLSRRVAPSERAEAFGRLNAFRGLFGFPAPAVGGLLYAWGGMRVPLIAGLIGLLAVMALLLFFVDEPALVHAHSE